MRLSFLLLPAFFVASLSASALATTWYVSPTGNDNNAGTLAKPLRTIQNALNSASSGETIILLKGTYSGLGNTNNQIANTTLTIKSLSGPAQTIIDCGGAGRSDFAFALASVGAVSAPLILDGITIVGSNAPNDSAIEVQSSYLSINNCVLSGNKSSRSGAALNIDSASNALIKSSTFSSNSCSSSFSVSGGAVSSAGLLAVENSLFRQNSITSTNGLNASANGGAISSSGNLSVKESDFLLNTSLTRGGAISCSGVANISACRFTGNNPTNGVGGAIYASGTSTLENSLIYGNVAQKGAGVYAGGNCAVRFCTFNRNAASADTGGGGALYVVSGTTTLQNSILWGDSASLVPSAAEIGNAGTIAVTYSTVQLGYVGTGNIKLNPLFVNAGNDDFHLQTTTPCLYAGSSIPGLVVDYAGRERHAPPTMGAYESGALWTPLATAVGPNKNTRSVWVSQSGQAWIWDVSPANVLTSFKAGPYTGLTPKFLAVGPDNHAYLAWIEPTGAIQVWNIAPDRTHTAARFAAASAWTAKSIDVGPDGVLHITWTDKPGELWVWHVPPMGATTYNKYGPFN